MGMYRRPLRSDELYHYGVIGMKWGVRRYQNYDGTLTKAGKERDVYKRRAVNAAKTKTKMDRLYNTLSNEDKRLLGDNEAAKEWLSVEAGEYVVKRLIKEVDKTPVAALDIMTTTKKGSYNIALMTDPKYRGKGYASELTKSGLDWYNKNKKRLGAKNLSWDAYRSNKASRRIAEKAGFKYNKIRSDKEWAAYDYK